MPSGWLAAHGGHAKAYAKELLRKATSVSGLDKEQGPLVVHTHPGPSLSFRAFSRLKHSLLEDDLWLAYQQSKQRAKERLHRALGAASLASAAAVPHQGSPSTSATSSSLAAAAARGDGSPAAAATAQQPSLQELEQLYGSDGYLRRSVIYIIGQASRWFMNDLNNTEVQGADVLGAALRRPAGQALITVSNHVAAMDDPLVVSSILPQEALSEPAAIRWTLCATDRCFKTGALVPFFRAAKVLPVQRGGGMAQAGMAAAEDRLRRGDWVHIFPEGTRSRDGTMGPVRKGVGRLVAACGGELPPLVVPFVHLGMEEVMPRGKLLPATGKQVKVLVGEPIAVADLLSAARDGGWDDDRLYAAIAGRVGQRLRSLKARLDGAEETADLAMGAAAAGVQDMVSPLDHFDPADVVGRTTVWERVKFKMGHRLWLLDSAHGTSTGAGPGAAVGMSAAAAMAVAGSMGGGAAAAAPSMGQLGSGSLADAALQEVSAEALQAYVLSKLRRLRLRVGAVADWALTAGVADQTPQQQQQGQWSHGGVRSSAAGRGDEDEGSSRAGRRYALLARSPGGHAAGGPGEAPSPRKAGLVARAVGAALGASGLPAAGPAVAEPAPMVPSALFREYCGLREQGMESLLLGAGGARL